MQWGVLISSALRPTFDTENTLLSCKGHVTRCPLMPAPHRRNANLIRRLSFGDLDIVEARHLLKEWPEVT